MKKIHQNPLFGDEKLSLLLLFILTLLFFSLCATFTFLQLRMKMHHCKMFTDFIADTQPAASRGVYHWCRLKLCRTEWGTISPAIALWKPTLHVLILQSEEMWICWKLVRIHFDLDQTQPLVSFFLLVCVCPLVINSVLISSAIPALENIFISWF